MGDPPFLTILSKRPVPLDAQLGLQRSRARIYPGMQDAAISAAGVVRQAIFFFKEHNIWETGGELSSDRNPDDTSAQDGDISRWHVSMAWRESAAVLSVCEPQRFVVFEDLSAA